MQVGTNAERGGRISVADEEPEKGPGSCHL